MCINDSIDISNESLRVKEELFNQGVVYQTRKYLLHIFDDHTLCFVSFNCTVRLDGEIQCAGVCYFGFLFTPITGLYSLMGFTALQKIDSLAVQWHHIQHIDVYLMPFYSLVPSYCPIAQVCNYSSFGVNSVEVILYTLR